MSDRSYFLEGQSKIDTTLSHDTIEIDKQLQSFPCKLYKFLLAMLMCSMMIVDYLLLTRPNALDVIVYAVSSYADGTGSQKFTLGVLASLILQGAGNMLYAIHVKSYKAAKGSIGIFCVVTFGVILLTILYPFHVSNYQFDSKLPYMIFGVIIIVLLLCILKGFTISRLFIQGSSLLDETLEDQEKAEINDEETFRVKEISEFLSNVLKLEKYSHVYYRTFLILILLLVIVYEAMVILYLLPIGPIDLPSLSQALFSCLFFILGVGCLCMLIAMHKKSYVGVKRAKIAFKIYNLGSILMIILAFCPMDSLVAKKFFVMNLYFMALAYVLVPILGYLGAVAVEKALRPQEALSILQFMLEQKLIAHADQVELVRDQVQTIDKRLEEHKCLRVYNWWLYIMIFLTLFCLEQTICTLEIVLLNGSLNLVWLGSGLLVVLMQILQIYGCIKIAVGFYLKNGKRIEKGILALKINFAGLFIIGALYYYSLRQGSKVFDGLELNGFALIYYLMIYQNNKQLVLNSLLLYLHHCFIQISCFAGVYYMKRKITEREEFCAYIKNYIPSRFHNEAI